MIQVAIFLSGNGSNAIKLIEQSRKEDNINVAVLVSDREDSRTEEIAQKFSIPFYILSSQEKEKSCYEKKILLHMEKYKVRWIFLAGYMRLLSKNFIQNFHDSNLEQARIINIHPSLLPKHRGLNAYKNAFKENERENGITIHFVDSGMDTGKIITQHKFVRDVEDTFPTFKSKGLKIEHKYYPKVLSFIAKHKTLKGYSSEI